jgi:4'-phosphopantetheinyl transferase
MIVNDATVDIRVESLERLPSEIAALWELLSVRERERAQQFVFPEHRRRFVVARGLLRIILGLELACDPRELRFTYGPHGKPELAIDADTLRFNVAHSRELVAYALTKRPTVGIDIEYVRDIDVETVARGFFSCSERRELDDASPGLRRQLFYAGWVRKEAFLKALGTGLSFGADRFDVSLGAPARLKRLPPDVEPDWQLHDFAPGAGYRGAIATRGRPPVVRVRRWACRL